MTANNNFLKATPLYKEYAILQLLSKDSNISQRAIAKQLDSSLSMINQYLEDYESRGMINRENINGRNMKYTLTKKGKVRVNYLNFQFLESIRETYLIAKNNITKFLSNILNNGYEKILMYGAGEVAELTLQVLNEEESIPLLVEAIIDDSEIKHGSKIMGIDVISMDKLHDYNIDGILISSYAHYRTLKDNLISMGYPKEKIFDYFTE